jgi:arylamine N-acetyltransferase
MARTTAHTTPGQDLDPSGPGLDGGTAAAYLRRLGLDAERPSPEALVRLHRAHVERVPYETFWIHLGERWGIDPVEAAGRIARGGRGGYCFHLNGAFSELLGHLGYEVTRHVAGVHDANGPSPATMTNHLALAVHGLPTDRNPEGRWYVDTGLGDAVHEPLPLVSGVYRHGPMRFALTAPEDGAVDWHLAHDPSGSFAGVSISADVTGMDAFEARHRFNATSPESSFARTVTAQRRHVAGVDAVRGCVLSHRVGATTTTVTFERQAEWVAMLADEFGLHLAVEPPAVDALWARVRDAHDVWLATEPAKPTALTG